MSFDPSAAHIIVGNQRYQVLRPQEFVTVEVGVDEETGEPRTEQQPLPREWDEAATMELVNRDHPPAKPEEPEEPTFEDVSS